MGLAVGKVTGCKSDSDTLSTIGGWKAEEYPERQKANQDIGPSESQVRKAFLGEGSHHLCQLLT